EVGIALEAAEKLGSGVRVVSAPCLERFDRQSAEYQEEVLPKACAKRLAIEAGVSGLWWKYVGTEGQVIGIDRFGLSAPGDQVFEKLGITAENIVAALS
ncbi:MAG: transketolase-like TK C-terminal-containing protein, partial [Verrucomicrobiales bacterium]